LNSSIFGPDGQSLQRRGPLNASTIRFSISAVRLGPVIRVESMRRDSADHRWRARREGRIHASSCTIHQPRAGGEGQRARPRSVERCEVPVEAIRKIRFRITSSAFATAERIRGALDIRLPAPGGTMGVIRASARQSAPCRWQEPDIAPVFARDRGED